MILFAILIAITAIGLFCWLLFTLATFALPLFAGIAAGTWAYHTGSGWIGAILIGLIGAALTLGLGQFLLIVVRPTWARLLIALIFVAPAAIAGYHATHGIVKHAMPSESWQIAFSIIGAVAVGITAFLRVAGMVAVPSGQGYARPDICTGSRWRPRANTAAITVITRIAAGSPIRTMRPAPE